MHPKNANRVEAISVGIYRELRSEKDADEFLASVLTQHLKNEVQAVESEVIKEYESLQRMQDIKIVFESPDVYIASAALIEQRFFIGKGDRNAFFEAILSSDPT